MALHGWIIIDKPLGMGSTNVVGWVKRALREAGEPKTRVGHGGTLDPLATGVLPIAIGEATKLAGHMLDATKAYDFTIAFGAQTDTLDLEGKVVATSEHVPTRGDLDAILPRFTGPIEQVPPAYSALKVDGKRAYALARAGEEVVLKTRAVTVLALQVKEEGARPGTASFHHPFRHRLQGHLYPQPRARHCAGARDSRPCHHVAADQGGAVRARTGDFTGLSGRCR